MDNEENTDEIKQQQSKFKINILYVFVFIVCLLAYYFLSAPQNSKDVIVHISSGESVNSISLELKGKNVIRSNFTLKFFIKLLKSGKGIIAGDYLIEKKSPVFVVAWQISRGYHKIKPIKITIREGLTNEEIASLLAQKLAGFRKDLFLVGVYDKQGYLFPDTYFFFPLDTTNEIIEKLSNNFETRIKKLSGQIDESSKSLKDIIIMASILEGEAGGEGDIATISGILWKRIYMGMPLQVDIDKSTYKTIGLPPSPLNNPGLLSIKASINPINSSYLYYLHDQDGKVHYAATFEEHKRNINKYLK